MSKIPARWERVKRAVEIRNELGSKTLIIGNGDLKDLDDAKQKIAETGVDGAMLGRAIFGNPWLFAGAGSSVHSENSLGAAEDFFDVHTASVFQRLQVLIEHTKLFEELLGDIKSFAIMKKNFKAYVEGFPGAKELRIRLKDANSASEVEEIIKEFSLALQSVSAIV
jgi:tRNA-dihydrouridine synthase